MHIQMCCAFIIGIGKDRNQTSDLKMFSLWWRPPLYIDYRMGSWCARRGTCNYFCHLWPITILTQKCVHISRKCYVHYNNGIAHTDHWRWLCRDSRARASLIIRYVCAAFGASVCVCARSVYMPWSWPWPNSAACTPHTPSKRQRASRRNYV